MKKLLFLLLLPALAFGQKTGTLSLAKFVNHNPNISCAVIHAPGERCDWITSVVNNVTYKIDDSLNYKGIAISEVTQQGTIEEHPQDKFFAGKLDYSVYRSPNNSTHWLIFLVGKGEVGDCAGGNIQLLYKYGFPKLLKAGQDFDFNILMVQPCGQNYPDAFKSTLIPWVIEEFKPSKIILSGISLGAICTLDMLIYDEYRHINAVVSLSGAPSASKGIDDAVSRMRYVPGYAYHGTQDTTVPYSKAIKFYNVYNTLNAGTDNIFTLDIQNTGHNGWDSVMAYNGKLHQWITAQFGPEPTGQTFEDGKQFVKDEIAAALEKL